MPIAATIMSNEDYRPDPESARKELHALVRENSSALRRILSALYRFQIEDGGSALTPRGIPQATQEEYEKMLIPLSGIIPDKRKEAGMNKTYQINRSLMALINALPMEMASAPNEARIAYEQIVHLDKNDQQIVTQLQGDWTLATCAAQAARELLQEMRKDGVLITRNDLIYDIQAAEDRAFWPLSTFPSYAVPEASADSDQPGYGQKAPECISDIQGRRNCSHNHRRRNANQRDRRNRW